MSMQTSIKTIFLNVSSKVIIFPVLLMNLYNQSYQVKNVINQFKKKTFVVLIF